MKVTVVIHEKKKQMEYTRKPFYMEDEGDVPQLMTDIEEFILDTHYELKEEV